MCELVLSEAGLLPHVNPGVMTREDILLLRPVSASMGLMLETASERLSGEGNAAPRLPRQAARRAPRDDPARRRARGPVHDGDPHRHRRDPRGADRGARGDRRPARPLRARPGGDRPELPREAGHEDGRAPRALPRGARLDGPDGARAPPRRRPPPGAPEPLLRRLSPAPRVGDRRLGRRLSGDDRPRQPRGSVARDRPPALRHRGPRPRAGPAAPDLPGVRRRPRALGRSARRARDPPPRRRLGPRARGVAGRRARPSAHRGSGSRAGVQPRAPSPPRSPRSATRSSSTRRTSRRSSRPAAPTWGR